MLGQRTRTKTKIISSNKTDKIEAKNLITDQLEMEMIPMKMNAEDKKRKEGESTKETEKEMLEKTLDPYLLLNISPSLPRTSSYVVI